MNIHKLNSKGLKANGFYKLGQIVSDGHLKQVKEIAEQYNIRVSNADKIVEGLKKNMNPSLLKENREGPPVHVSQVLEIKETIRRGTSLYRLPNLQQSMCTRTFIAKTFTEPTAAKRWESVA